MIPTCESSTIYRGIEKHMKYQLNTLYVSENV